MLGALRGRRRWIAVGGLIMLTVLALAAWAPWRERDSPPIPSGDPRVNYSGPYLNIHPDVAYVGDARCATCHQDQADSYQHHPMARSLRPINQFDHRRLDAPRQQNAFPALGAEFRVTRDDRSMAHHEIRRDRGGQEIYENTFKISHVIGSGSHAHSFLCDRDGRIFQSPVTWYSSKGMWDLSPGWQKVNGGRAVAAGCLFCHANRVEPVAGTRNQYESPLLRGAGIGCERCHGPGGKHVEIWEGRESAPEGQDFSIVNPAKLDPRLRDAVCEQCHLEGESRLVKRGRGLFDYRPGLPLEEFLSIFVRSAGPDGRFVNHVEQMHASRCFIGTKGQGNALGCISCHDPHVKVAAEARVNHFRSACLKCHAEKGCSMPEPERKRTEPRDSCITCHMPLAVSDDIVHTATTDHRIRRRPAPPGVPTHFGGLPVRSFHQQDAGPRDTGLALAELTYHGKITARFAGEAVAKLDEALRADPADVDAWEAKARAMQALGRLREAASAYRQALEREPRRESSVAEAAGVSARIGDKDEAERFWRLAIDIDPWQQEYHGNLALLLQARGDWIAVRDHALACLRLSPDNMLIRKLLAYAYLQTGDKGKAREELRRLEALDVPDLENLRQRLR